MVIFTLGLAVPFVVISILVWHAGVWDKFWFWTFRYAREYVSLVPLDTGWEKFKNEFPRVVGPSLWIWALAGAGLLALFADKHVPFSTRVALPLFAIFSVLTVMPGLYFRPHYFVTTLPVVALLAGNGCAAIGRYITASGLKGRWTTAPVVLGICALLWALIQQWSFFFAETPHPLRVGTLSRGNRDRPLPGSSF
jgi:hypothetical protein